LLPLGVTVNDRRRRADMAGEPKLAEHIIEQTAPLAIV
jgi:hypothetical protein